MLQYFKSECRTFLECEDEIKHAYRTLMGAGYFAVSERLPSKFGNIDNAFVDRKGAFLAGFGEDSLKKIRDLMDFQTFKIDNSNFAHKF